MSDAVAGANALTARWAPTACAAGTNTTFSGAGVWPLLGLLAAGADETVRPDLEAALGLAAGPAVEAAVELIAAVDAAAAAQAALGLWTAPALAVDPGWAARLPADVHRTLTGDLGTDQHALDAWASEHTGGLVPALPVRLTPVTALVLASAVALKTDWAVPFTEASWSGGETGFGGGSVARLDRDTTDLDAVSVVETTEGRLTVVRVAGTEDVDVHLALGEEGRAAGSVVAGAIAALDPAGARSGGATLDGGPGISVSVIPKPQPTLRLRTPAFRVTGSYDLLARADLFGLARAGSGRHFPGLSSPSVDVEAARQDAVAVFTATGFEAAAVTAVAMRMSAVRAVNGGSRLVVVSFDRPFGFLAVHRPTGLVLVAGWVADPTPATS